jgi:hypothetical protein
MLETASSGVKILTLPAFLGWSDHYNQMTHAMQTSYSTY